MDNKIICACCGEEINEFDALSINGEFLCEECADEKYTFCEYHYDYEPVDEVEIVRDYNGNTYTMCSDGVYDYFLECEECGNLVPRDEVRYHEGDDLCPDCYQERLDNQVIKCYHASHGVDKTFFGESANGIYMGFEIESERKDSSDDTLNSIAKNVKDDNIENLLFFERDGSLNYGFETITNPLSYEFIVNNNVIYDIVDSLDTYGMYTPSSCGLHIHITRTKEVEEMLPNILMFVENNKEDMIKFSNRTKHSFEEWCDFYTYSDEEIVLLDAYKIISRAEERHMVINFTNRATVEFRCFAGTLDADRIMGYIEFLQLLIKEAVKDFNDVYNLAEKYNYEYLLQLLGRTDILSA